MNMLEIGLHDFFLNLLNLFIKYAIASTYKSFMFSRIRLRKIGGQGDRGGTNGIVSNKRDWLRASYLSGEVLGG
jgi:hypothetical protein